MLSLCVHVNHICAENRQTVGGYKFLHYARSHPQSWEFKIPQNQSLGESTTNMMMMMMMTTTTIFQRLYPTQYSTDSEQFAIQSYINKIIKINVQL